MGEHTYSSVLQYSSSSFLKESLFYCDVLMFSYPNNVELGIYSWVLRYEDGSLAVWLWEVLLLCLPPVVLPPFVIYTSLFCFDCFFLPELLAMLKGKFELFSTDISANPLVFMMMSPLAIGYMVIIYIYFIQNVKYSQCEWCLCFSTSEITLLASSLTIFLTETWLSEQSCCDWPGRGWHVTTIFTCLCIHY